MSDAPERGDIAWIDLDPQTGSEQAGRRPVLVLSPRKYNEPTGLFLACPLTTKVKGYPFEVTLPFGTGVEGVVLADHVKSLDWRARRAQRITTLDPEFVDAVAGIISTIIGVDA